MKLTKETLKKIIKEELDNALNEDSLQEGMNMAYFNNSMDDRVELAYDGKRIDFMYRDAGAQGNKVRSHIMKLSRRGGRIGDIRGMAEFMHRVLVDRSGYRQSDLPSIETLKSLPVYDN